MKRLDGKKLLIVSSDSSDISFVEAAKSLGAYVICCDRYTDYKISPAKALADEAWDMDYSDIKRVAKRCRESGVDGVIAGYSEDRVMAACQISKEIGTPFYATEEQIQLTRNKKLFKDLCRSNKVSVPRDYMSEDLMQGKGYSDVHFPVIVKPTDSGGRKGISICRNEAELEAALPLAAKNSKTGEVVVEDYLEGIELCAVYTIVDGVISLSCLNDKYISTENGDASKLCAFVVTPSKYYERYLTDVDPQIRALLKSIDAKNGAVNFQFIVNEEGIHAFEMGYRVNGNDDFKVIRKYNGIDFSKMLVSYSLIGEMGDSLEKDDPCFPKYTATLVVYLRGGVIGKIDYSGLNKLSGIDDISIKKCVGNTVIDTGTTGQKIGMIKFSAESIDEIIKLANTIENSLEILDIEAKSMILPMFDTRRLQEA